MKLPVIFVYVNLAENQKKHKIEEKIIIKKIQNYIMEFEPVIGLEVHVELKTQTKMFCRCLNNSLETIPNKNICEVCLGYPGALPTINKKAMEGVLMVGLALNGKIPEYSKFDRKNYFYPDLPKGYQISQYDMPFIKGGALPLFLSSGQEEKKVTIMRIHLEEDTGKLIHGLVQEKAVSLIDFNRAGVPLMELVTEPVISSGKEARLFSQGLQVLLRALEVSEADMEKGQMRCEVNISLRPRGEKNFGTKVEIKNLNSFRAVEKSIDFEIKRQTGILSKGEKVVQETRGWDDAKEITFSQRIKEEAEDYRYFPEPDLPPIHLYSEEEGGGLFDLEELKKRLPELPWEKKKRLIKEYKIPSEGANLLVQEEKILKFFEETISCFEAFDLNAKEKAASLTYNYLISDILGIKEKEGFLWENLKITPLYFSRLINYLVQDKISSRAAKDILLEIVKNGGDPERIIKERNLEKVSDQSVLLPMIEEVVKNNPKALGDYKKGKAGAIQFLVGQVMGKTRGAADPKVLEEIIKNKLKD